MSVNSTLASVLMQLMLPSEDSQKPPAAPVAGELLGQNSIKPTYFSTEQAFTQGLFSASEAFSSLKNTHQPSSHHDAVKEGQDSAILSQTVFDDFANRTQIINPSSAGDQLNDHDLQQGSAEKISSEKAQIDQELFLLGQNFLLGLLAQLMSGDEVEDLRLDGVFPWMLPRQHPSYRVSHTEDTIDLVMPRKEYDQWYSFKKTGELTHIYFDEFLTTEFGRHSHYGFYAITYLLDAETGQFRFISQKEVLYQFASLVQYDRRSLYNVTDQLDVLPVQRFLTARDDLFGGENLSSLNWPKFILATDDKTFSHLFFPHLKGLDLCLVASQKTALQFVMEDAESMIKGYALRRREEKHRRRMRRGIMQPLETAVSLSHLAPAFSVAPRLLVANGLLSESPEQQPEIVLAAPIEPIEKEQQFLEKEIVKSLENSVASVATDFELPPVFFSI